MEEFWREIPRPAITLALTLVIVSACSRLGYQPGKNMAGWTKVSPGPIPIAAGVGIIFIAFWILSGFASMIENWDNVFSKSDDLFFVFIVPPFFIFLLYGGLHLLFADLRFSSQGIQYRFLLRRVEAPWSLVKHIKRGFSGPTVYLVDGRHFVVSEFNRGYQCFIAAASENGVEVAV